jgi:hypothetical protein
MNNTKRVRRKKNKPGVQPLRVISEVKSIPNSLTCDVKDLCLVSHTWVDGAQPLNQSRHEQLKHYDVYTPSLAITSSATILPLSGITQGTGITQRVGDAVEIKALIFNWNLYMQNGDVFNATRIIVFQWLESTSVTTPSPNSILEGLPTVQDFYNWANSPRFRILYDGTFFQSGTSTNPTPSGNVGMTGQLIPLNAAKKTLQFTPGTTQQFGGLFVLFISDSTIAPFPTTTFNSRLLYND